MNDDIIKQNLSYAHRIIAKLGMDDHTYTHITARPQGADYFFITPFGLRFEEVGPESLLKIDLDTFKILNSEFGDSKVYNLTGAMIHGSIYRARPDINSVFHLHTPSSVAVSSLKDGLMPISQWALHFYEKVAYHEYNSLVLDIKSEGEGLVKSLGRLYTMLLRNHGSITCGKTIHEAMFYTHHLEQACKAQVAALSCARELIIPDAEICRKSVNDILAFEKDLGIRDWKAWVRWVK